MREFHEHWQAHAHAHGHAHGPGRKPHPSAWAPHLYVMWFVRAKLHRRLFAWFGATILVTMLAVASVLLAFNYFGTSPGPDTFKGAQRVLLMTLDDTWEDTSKRGEVLQQVAETFKLAVTLEDTEHGTRQVYGLPASYVLWRTDVLHAGHPVGTLSVATDRRRPGRLRQLALILGVAWVVLWLASGKLARHLVRPYADLTRIAEDLGHGRLSSRVQLGPHQRRETRVLAESLNAMAERIERQLQEQKELLAAVSHELRTPLARVRLLVELGRTRGLDAKTADELDVEAMEMDRLVGELLASARLEFSALDARPLEARELVLRSLERAGLPATLLCVSDDGPFALNGDPTLLGRAMLNLLENGARHGQGVTQVRIGREGEGIRISVEDHGPGISPGDEARIFQAFHRGRGAAEGERTSLGLGLALVKRIAEAHEGRAFAENLPGGGARVGVVLPPRAAAAG